MVKLPLIQNTGPVFSGLETHSDRMDFRRFLSRFVKCVGGLANDEERLNFVKCCLSGRHLQLMRILIIDTIFQAILNISLNGGNLFLP